MKFKIPEEDNVGFQMAPWIDCVFLLVMFFMVAARLITQTERVPIEVPFAENATVPKDPSGRIAMTIQVDETVVSGAQKLTLPQVTEMVKERVKENPNVRIFLRADKRLKHKAVREVMKACADGGVADIIFSAYQSEK